MNLSRFTRSFGFRQTMLLTAGCFVLIALGVTGVTFVSRDYSRRGTQQTETLTSQFLPGLVTLARLQDTAQNLKTITYQFALAKDEVAMTEQKKSFHTTILQVGRSVAELKVLASDEPTQRLITAFAADVQSYGEVAERFQTELGAGEFEKAMATLDHQIGPAQQKIETQLEALSERYFDLAHNAGTHTSELLAQSDRFGILATGVLAGFTLLCLVLSLAATRALLAQMQKRDVERQAAQDTLEKRVEERTAALSASEERIRLIVDTASDAIITADAAGAITAWNRQAEKTCGWTQAEALGRNLTTLIAPSHREAHRQRIERFFASGDSAALRQRIEINVLHQDGHELPAEVVLSPIRLGETVLFSFFLHDISERKRAQAELEQLHRDLLQTSRQAGMAEIATNVLHNVGNVLNSVNTSVSIATDKVRGIKVSTLDRLAALLNGQEDLATFFTRDPRGVELPVFLTRIAARLASDQALVLGELDAVRRHIEHINEIVAMQQDYAHVGGVTEVLPLTDLIEDALRLNAGSIERHGLKIVRDYADLPPALVDRHKVLQILVNLIRNAKHALDDGAPTDKRLTLRLAMNGGGRAKITVSDNGIGIPSENLTRIFTHGFTTRKGGHGFGLHGSANDAREMGGSLTAASDGHGRGASFALELQLQPASPTS